MSALDGFRRSSMTCALFLGLSLLCACACVWPIPSAGDNAESYSVCKYVESRGVVPESAAIGRDRTRCERFVLVTGVEDRAIQDEVIAAATEARRLHSTKPVVVVFYVGTVVKDRSGGAKYPDGRREIRREVIP
jgi:hypothetical protein